MLSPVVSTRSTPDARRSSASPSWVLAEPWPNSSISPRTAMRRPPLPGIHSANTLKAARMEAGDALYESSITVAVLPSFKMMESRRPRPAGVGMVPSMFSAPSRSPPPTWIAASTAMAFCAEWRPGSARGKSSTVPMTSADTMDAPLPRKESRRTSEPELSPKDTMRSMPRVRASSASRSKEGLSRLRMAVPAPRMPSKISDLAKAISSTDLKNSRCTASTVVMMAISG